MDSSERESAGNDKYRSFFESAYDAIFIADAQTGMIIDANAEAERLFGYKKDELIKMHQTDLHPAEDKQKYTKIFQDHFNKKKAFEQDVVIEDKNGKKIHVSIRANVIQLGERQFIHGIFHVIEKPKEDVLDRYRSYFEGAFDAIMIHDLETGAIVDCNEEAEKLFGYKKSELLKLDRLSIHPPEYREEYSKKYWEFIKSGEHIEIDLLCLHKNGKSIPATVRSRIIQVGPKKYIHGIFRDITKFKEIEDFLKNKISSLEEVLNFIKGREERIVALKKEIDLLLKQLKKPSKYGY